MKNPFIVDKSFSLRHQILEVLYKDWDNNNHEENRRVGSIKIANDTKIPIADVHVWQHLLVESGEIIVSDNDGQLMITILQKGISAYIDKRYIKRGKQTRWDDIFAWARILIPLGALILSIINYYANKNISNKVKEIENKIEKIK